MNRRKKQIRSDSHRRKKRNRVFKKAGLVAGVVIVCIALLAWGSRLDYMSIQKISVDGNSVATSASIKSVTEKQLSGRYGYIFSRRNSIIYPRSSIASVIQTRFHRVKEVDLSLEDIQTLNIEITERSPAGVWCNSSYDNVTDQTPCYFLDKTGYIYAKAPHFSDNVFFRYHSSATTTQPVGTRFMSQEIFKRLNAFTDAIHRRLELNPVGFAKVQSTDGRIILEKKADSQEQFSGSILFDYTDNLKTLFENLKTITNKEIYTSEIQKSDRSLTAIDLRFGNKVYFRFEEEASTVAGASTQKQATTTEE